MVSWYYWMLSSSTNMFKNSVTNIIGMILDHKHSEHLVNWTAAL